LAAGYLEDADALRVATVDGLRPAHQCKRAQGSIKGGRRGDTPQLHSACNHIEPWDGPTLVRMLESWLRYGHVIEETDVVGGYRANESADLERVEADFTLWLNKQCIGLKKTLARQLHKFGKNNTRHRKVRAKALRESMHQLNHFRKASMSKAVQHSTFWRYPGKVANLVERQALQTVQLCSTRLRETVSDHEARLLKWWLHMRQKAKAEADRAKERARLQSINHQAEEALLRDSDGPRVDGLKDGVDGAAGSRGRTLTNGTGGVDSEDGHADRQVRSHRGRGVNRTLSRQQANEEVRRKEDKVRRKAERKAIAAAVQKGQMTSRAASRPASGGREECFTVYD